MAAVRQVQLLEQSLLEIQRGGTPEELRLIQERLIAAQAELAAIGDCGD